MEILPTTILGGRAADILGFEKEERWRQELDYLKAILRFSSGIYAIRV